VGSKIPYLVKQNTEAYNMAKLEGLWLVVLVIGGLILFDVGGIQGKLGIGTGATTPPPGGNPPAGSADCQYLPTVNALAGFDAIKTATAATPTTGYYFLNGAYFGTTAPPVKKGDVWRVLGDLNGYLAEEKSVTITCGANSLVHSSYAYANATVVLKDDPVSSGNTLTQNNAATTGTGNNATAITSGGQRNIGIILQGTVQKSSGNILLIVEGPASSASKVSSMSLTCGGTVMPSVAIPNGFAATAAASVRAAWAVPAIVGAESKSCVLQIQDVAGQTLSGLVSMDYFAMQKAVLADGTIAEVAYDSTPNGANAAKYQDTYTSDFVLQ
jgi:hypothetical protein